MHTIPNTPARTRWMMALSLSFVGLMFFCSSLSAQQYLGTDGLIHVPTADMDSAGVARVGIHYVDKEMIPDRMKVDGHKFNSLTNYLSITPFSWVEVGYGYTLWRLHKDKKVTNGTGFYAKDRYFSLRLQPLKEGRYWPSVVLGGNDVWGSGDDGHSGSNYYRNYYAAVTKHFDVGVGRLGTHLAYREWHRSFNHKWNGLVGGLSFQPSFYEPLRIVGEWDGNEVNVGADCTLFKYFLVQASLQRFRYFSGGLCFRIGLL